MKDPKKNDLLRHHSSRVVQLPRPGLYRVDYDEAVYGKCSPDAHTFWIRLRADDTGTMEFPEGRTIYTIDDGDSAVNFLEGYVLFPGITMTRIKDGEIITKK